jgi:hypothetical protein
VGGDSGYSAIIEGKISHLLKESSAAMKRRAAELEKKSEDLKKRASELEMKKAKSGKAADGEPKNGRK